MKFRILSIIAVSALCILSSCSNDGNASIGKLDKGINISYWLSQNPSQDRHREWFHESDIAKLDSLGFDHIRLPLDEEHLFDENYVPQQRAFELMRDAISWCQKRNMKVIADLHTIRSHVFAKEGNTLFTDSLDQAHFYYMWDILSDSLACYPNDLVAYEILNEPVADEHEQWNVILKKTVEIIRAKEPERTLLLTSNLWQRFDTTKDLYIPENDKNLIIAFHYYEPMPLTHYSFTFKDLGPINYPGLLYADEIFDSLSEEDLDKYGWMKGETHDLGKIDAQVRVAVDAAAAHGLKAYCSEFGIFSTVPYESRERWFKDLISVFEKYGVGHASWEYMGHFGVICEGEVVPYMI